MLIGNVNSFIIGLMNKLLIAASAITVIGLFTAGSAIAAPGLPTGTDNGTRNFSSIQQYQFNKEETLDFTKDPEQYKQRRDKKNKYLDYQEGKVDLTPSVKNQYQTSQPRPGSNNLQFVRDENGKIRIKNTQ